MMLETGSSFMCHVCTAVLITRHNASGGLHYGTNIDKHGLYM